MGHHSTYRKRGTAQAPHHALVRPSPPVLSKATGHLIATSSFSDNTGGVSHLYYSDDEGITWQPYGEHVWNQIMDWGDTGDLDPGQFYATSEGDGTDYINESDPSNIVLVP